MHRFTASRSEQFDPLDLIRGLALLGMLLIQAQTYARFASLRAQLVGALPLDRAESYIPTQFFLHLLVHGSCCGLFSVGFGWCFYRFWQSIQPLEREADRIARRGLWALLALGLLHGLVGGCGDILHQYALLGFTLVYFVNRPASTLFNWIVGLAGLGMFIQLIGFLIVSLFPAAGDGLPGSWLIRAAHPSDRAGPGSLPPPGDPVADGLAGGQTGPA